ncbi:MAG: hypothetical protein MJ174_06015 [Treponema sp.]|nr:hypothetical protein [Treponema sp.]
MKYFFFLIFIPFIFLSCSKEKDSVISVENEETLKYLISERQSIVNWAKEIEPEILETDIGNIPSISQSVSVSKELMGLIKQDNNKIYPSISDFTILDNSSLNEKALNTVKNFGSAVCSNLNCKPDLFMSKNYYFLYQFFKSNLLENWETMFNEKFPNTFEDITNKDKKIVLFNDFLIGKENETQDFIEIPVRLIAKDKYLNIVICVEKVDNYSIDEISISGWGIYGK